MIKTCIICKREYARDSYLDHTWHEEEIKYCLGQRTKRRQSNES